MKGYMHVIWSFYLPRKSIQREIQGIYSFKYTRDRFDGAYIVPAPPSSSHATYLIELPPESRAILGSPTSLDHEASGFFSITLMESRKTAEGGTTGFRTWQPSLLFADWLLRNPCQ
jgi:hypothetical protein